MTKEELKAQLTIVQTAIGALIAGERVTELSLASDDFKEMYSYSDVTLENLTDFRDNLLEAIRAIEPSMPVFRQHTSIPLVVNKGVW